MDRRQFLRCAAGAFTVSSLASALSACNTTTGGNSGLPNTGMGIYKFPQGLCCGDPGSNSGVFWTRVVRADGTSGDIPVTLEISLTPVDDEADSFRLFKQIRLVAQQSSNYIIHHKLTDLEPDTSYFFRFVAGGDASNPVGRLRTLPVQTAEVTSAQFAMINGLDWSYNHWEAMTESALRNRGFTSQTYFMLLLGGAISDFVPKVSSLRSEPDHQALNLPDGFPVSGLGIAAKTLADYVYLQQVYRSDLRLQKLLSSYTLMPMFGENDFSNDCWADHETYTNGNLEQRDRLLAALAAWMQYMPLDWGDVAYDPASNNFSQIRLFRNFRFGNLVNLILTEQRLQRTDHAIAEDGEHGPLGLTGGIGSRLLADPTELANHASASQKILGDEQSAWLKNQLTSQGVVWKLMAGESPFMHLPLDLSKENDIDAALRKTSLMSADSWEGYPTQQKELVSFIQQQKIGNVVSLACGGLFSASEIWADYTALRNPVMLECTVGPMSRRALTEETADALANETDPRYVALKQIFSQSFRVDQRLVKQLEATVRHINTGTRGYAMVYVRTGELVVDLTRIADSGVGGKVTGSLITGRTRVTIKSGQLEMAITEFSS